jgi:hypothetical protein
MREKRASVVSKCRAGKDDKVKKALRGADLASLE